MAGAVKRAVRPGDKYGFEVTAKTAMEMFLRQAPRDVIIARNMFDDVVAPFGDTLCMSSWQLMEVALHHPLLFVPTYRLYNEPHKAVTAAVYCARHAPISFELLLNTELFSNAVCIEVLLSLRSSLFVLKHIVTSNHLLTKLFLRRAELPDVVAHVIADADVRAAHNAHAKHNLMLQMIEIKLDLIKGVRGTQCDYIYKCVDTVYARFGRSKAVRSWLLAMYHDLMLQFIEFELAVTFSDCILPCVLPVPVTQAAVKVFEMFVSEEPNISPTNGLFVGVHTEDFSSVYESMCKWWAPCNHHLQRDKAKEVVETVMLCAARARSMSAKATTSALPFELWVAVLGFLDFVK